MVTGSPHAGDCTRHSTPGPPLKETRAPTGAPAPSYPSFGQTGAPLAVAQSAHRRRKWTTSSPRSTASASEVCIHEGSITTASYALTLNGRIMSLSSCLMVWQW
jgi:hypothetical protein